MKRYPLCTDIYVNIAILNTTRSHITAIEKLNAMKRSRIFFALAGNPRAKAVHSRERERNSEKSKKKSVDPVSAMYSRKVDAFYLPSSSF